MATNFKYEIKYGIAKIIEVISDDNVILVPKTLDGKNVYKICANAFSNLSCEKIVLPNTVGEIEELSFIGLSNLKYFEVYTLDKFKNIFLDIDLNKVTIYTHSIKTANKIYYEYAREYPSLKIYSDKDFRINILDKTLKTAEITKFTVRGENIYFPDEIDGYKIVSICGKISHKIDTLHLPKYLENIPDEFLMNQEFVSKINFPKTLKTIGKKAFYNTIFASKVNISNLIEEIKEKAFEIPFKNSVGISDNNLKISFEKGTKVKLNNYCLAGRTVYFADNCSVELGEAVFYGSTVKNLHLNSSNKIIPAATFENAYLYNFDGFENVEIIEVNAFGWCHFKNIKTLDLRNVKEVGQFCFAQTNIKKVYIGKNLKLSDGMFEQAAVSNVFFDKDYAFDTIPYRCFCGVNYLKSITLPKSIKVIGESAFNNSKIAFINLEFVESIGELAFTNTLLKKIDLRNLKTLNPRAFMNCHYLESVHMGRNKLYKIGDGAFHLCPLLSKIKLSKETRVIGSEAFYKSGLEEINLENVTIINKYAFSSTLIKEANLKSVYRLGKYSFFEDKNLEKVVISKKCDKLPEGCFKYCVHIKEIKIPNVKYFGYKCLAGLELKDFYLPDSTEIVDGYAFCSSHFENFYFKNGNKIVYKFALGGLYSVQNIYIDKIKKIPTGFIDYISGLNTLVLGESVEIIGNEAIKKNKYLKTVVIKNKNCTIGKGNFLESEIDTFYFDNEAEIKKLKKRRALKIKNFKEVKEYVK